MQTALETAPQPTLSDMLAAALIKVQGEQLDLAQLIECANELAAHDPSMAATLYKTWIAYNAAHFGVHVIYFNYAVVLASCSDLAGAANALRETIRIKPDFGPPHINLGSILEQMGRSGPAVESWYAFIGKTPELTPDAVNYKALALKQVGRVLELTNQDSAAEDALRRCLEFDSTQHDAIQHFVSLRQRQCKWPLFGSGAQVSDQKLRAAMSPLSAAYHTDDPIFQLANAYTHCRRDIGLPPGTRGKRSEPAAPADIQRRLRVGYVSSDLRDHAVGFAMTDVIESHDRNRIETFVYYCGIDPEDAIKQRIRQAADRWTNITGLDDTQAAQTIRRDGIDILVDLNGYTKDGRTMVFAMRPAPIAVNWFGFPGSMASPYHHYIIADAHVIPPSHEMYYSEQVLRLPCYQPNDRKRVVAPTAPTREQAGLPDGAFVFSALNGLQKLTPATFDRWMSILRQVPDSVLWLLPGTSETNDRLRAAAQAGGIVPTRLIFADRARNADHLARMALADLFLDTFPYGAHTTASDALWMGLPVLTLKGRSFASRVCASLVSAAGTPEMVCSSGPEYVARAVQLATNPAQLGHIRDRLKSNRAACALFDTANLVRCLEALYEQMRDDRFRGALPKPDLRNLEIYHEIAAAEALDTAETLTDAAYLQQYQERLRDLDSVFPIGRDARLWTASA